MLYLLIFISRLLNSQHENNLTLITTTINQCKLKNISNNFLICLIIAEDKRFFYHHGIDCIAILRALYKTINRELQGASTITQQLVRTITKEYKISMLRKIKESLLSMIISKSFTKDKIALTYLSIAYFGKAESGLKSVCQFLNIDIKKANIIQAAEVISRLKYPNSKNKINKRTFYILKKNDEYKKSQRRK